MRTVDEMTADLASFDAYGRGPWLARLAADVGDLLAENEGLRAEAVLLGNALSAHAARAETAETAAAGLSASLAASQVAADDITAALDTWAAGGPAAAQVDEVRDLAAAVAHPARAEAVRIEEGFVIELPPLEAGPPAEVEVALPPPSGADVIEAVQRPGPVPNGGMDG